MADKRVWVCRERHPSVRRDMSSAELFGEIQYILKFTDPRPENKPTEAMSIIRERLGPNVKEGDYFLDIGGSPMTPFLVGRILGELQIHRVSWLRWDRRIDKATGHRTYHGHYTPVEA